MKPIFISPNQAASMFPYPSVFRDAVKRGELTPNACGEFRLSHARRVALHAKIKFHTIASPRIASGADTVRYTARHREIALQRAAERLTLAGWRAHLAERLRAGAPLEQYAIFLGWLYPGGHSRGGLGTIRIGIRNAIAVDALTRADIHTIAKRLGVTER